MSKPKFIKMPDGHFQPVIAYQRGLMHHTANANRFVREADLGGEGLPYCEDPSCDAELHFARIPVGRAVLAAYRADVAVAKIYLAYLKSKGITDEASLT